MTWYGVATVAAGILSAIVLLGAAVTAGAKLWRYRFTRVVLSPFTWSARTLWAAWNVDREERFVERVRPIIAEEVSVLMQPNGGNSVADVAQAVRALRSELTAHFEQADRRDQRIDELAADIGVLRTDLDPTTED